MADEQEVRQVPEGWVEGPCANPECPNKVLGPPDMPEGMVVCSQDCAMAIIQHMEAQAALDSIQAPSAYLEEVKRVSELLGSRQWLQDAKMCATCLRVLDEKNDLTTGAIIGYRHTPFDQTKLTELGQMHNPDPIPIDGSVLLRRCDFCNIDLDPTEECWVLPADDFHIAGNEFSRGDWAACSPCIDLIVDNRWGRLIARVAAFYKQNLGADPPPKVVMEEWYGRLRDSIKGPPFLESEVDWSEL